MQLLKSVPILFIPQITICLKGVQHTVTHTHTVLRPAIWMKKNWKMKMEETSGRVRITLYRKYDDKNTDICEF